MPDTVCVAAVQVVYGARCVEKLGLESICASEEGSAAETRAVPSLQLLVRCYSCECAFPRKESSEVLLVQYDVIRSYRRGNLQ